MSGYNANMDDLESNPDIIFLLRKKMDGTINDQELQMLEAWGAEDPIHAELLRKVEDEEVVVSDLKDRLAFRTYNVKTDWIKTFEEKTMAKIYSAGNQKPTINVPIWRRYLSYLPYAALCLSVLTVGLLVYRNQDHHTLQATSVADLKPGGNKAYITLSDGNVIELRQDQEGVVLGKEMQYEDGTLIHNLKNDETSYSTISTPKGGQYQITLSDGTKVWLNADSKLKYPSSFNGNARIVELVGEAYFDVETLIVKGEKIPFRVKTVNQEVEVLGTQFNLKAYANEQDDVRTTLVEGSVLLHAGDDKLPLEPGEQASNDGQKLHKKKVDVGPYIAWKDNRFIFEEVELQEALKVLSRWYDFDFDIDQQVKPTYLYASISRGKSLKEVLKIIESSGIKFKLERLHDRNKLTIFN